MTIQIPTIQIPYFDLGALGRGIPREHGQNLVDMLRRQQAPAIEAPPRFQLTARMVQDGAVWRGAWVDFDEVTTPEQRALVARIIGLETVAEEPRHAAHKLFDRSGIKSGYVWEGPEQPATPWAGGLLRCVQRYELIPNAVESTIEPEHWE